jgi:hypothetical protein
MAATTVYGVAGLALHRAKMQVTVGARASPVRVAVLAVAAAGQACASFAFS